MIQHMNTQQAFKKFTHILYIGFNRNIQQQLGRSYKSKFCKTLHQANSTIQPIHKYLIILSINQLPNNVIQQFQILTRQHDNLYSECIIFWEGKKMEQIVSFGHYEIIGEAINDLCQVEEAIRKIENKYKCNEEKPSLTKKNPYKLILINDKEYESDMHIVVQLQVKKMSWKSINIAKMTMEQFQENMEAFYDNSNSQYIIFSYHEEYTIETIENLLGSYQQVSNWIILYEGSRKQNVFDFNRQFTIEPRNFKRFKYTVDAYLQS